MRNPNALGALREYGRVGVQSQVETASPHRLVQMLMDGALARVSAARNGLGRGDLATKGENVGWAISIVDCLNASVDAEAGGEISANLSALYEYIIRRLLEANVQNDPEILDEVGRLLREIKGGWDAISDANSALAAGGVAT